MAKKYNTPEQQMHTLQDTLREEYGRKQIEERTELPSYFKQSLNPKFALRPYQDQCFKYFINYWENDFSEKEQCPQLLFHMATGSGKTLIMAGLMLYLFEKGYHNFLFFVNSTNIIEKTKDNFLNMASSKYLFAPSIKIGEKRVEIRMVDNFQGVEDDCINLCLTTIQGLHTSLNTPHENALTYDDFGDQKIVLISDEAHHMNSSTKKGKKVKEDTQLSFDMDIETSDDWETTVMRIFQANTDSEHPNVLLEFTATEDLSNEYIQEKYKNKVIFDYPLKKFREDGYSKDIEVVQSDLSPIDRAMQTVVLSQYKRKLFNAIGQDIKPVMMLKSKTIKENKEFYLLFIETIKKLSTNDLAKIKDGAAQDIKAAFVFFEERKITLENLLLEIKEDFKEENLLIVDGNTITAEKQLQLNSLEAKDNEFRCVFAVDMLNEGWDVLNLYDIVRLYEGRDAKDGKPGKTTMAEAQLIGRGARYMPFEAPEEHKPTGQRKYDDDITNRLRVVEKLHYHSSYNPRYLDELTTAMEDTGIIAKRSKVISMKLKDSFKKTALYNDGYIFVNEKEPYEKENITNSFTPDILEKVYKVRIRSGQMKSSLVFEKTENNNIDDTTRTHEFILKEMGNHVIRAAINSLEAYKFSNLKEVFPTLPSIRHFIESENYLANIHVAVASKEEVLENLTQKQKLGVVIEVLKQIEPQLIKSAVALRGSKRFRPKVLKDFIKDKELKVSLDNSEDKEFGRSMKEPNDLFLSLDLSKHNWFAFDDFFGTSEEKHLVKYIEQLYPKLQKKYEDIYLVRSEREVRIFDFETGNAFEPDFLLFMREKKQDKYVNMQIFIEPKGDHLKQHDEWKEKFLLQLKERSLISFETETSEYRIWGMPFYSESSKIHFDKTMKENFNVSGWG